jgi:hypothetical protein
MNDQRMEIGETAEHYAVRVTFMREYSRWNGAERKDQGHNCDAEFSHVIAISIYKRGSSSVN